VIGAHTQIITKPNKQQDRLNERNKKLLGRKLLSFEYSKN
jgi:hypothetical protein